MKAVLRISILLNLGLISFLILVLSSGRQMNPNVAPPVTSGAALDMVEVARDPLPVAVPGVESKPFHWSQVESSDYRTYIADLRGIGCPEQTICDIITADVDSLYAPRREALQRQLETGGSFAAGVATRRALEKGLEKLRDEEASLVANLLGTQPASTEVVVAAPPPSREVRRNPGTQEISVPLAFQEVDPAALKLDSSQVWAISNLRQRFVDQVGGPNQDPNDPAYCERWQKAQPELDDMMRGMIGVNAFQDYQLAARALHEKPGDQQQTQ